MAKKITCEVRSISKETHLYVWVDEWLEFREPISAEDAVKMAHDILAAFGEEPSNDTD